MNLKGIEGQGILGGKGNFRSMCMLSWHSAPREAEHVPRAVT